MLLNLLKLYNGEGLVFAEGFLSRFCHAQVAHIWEIIWGQLSGLHLFFWSYCCCLDQIFRKQLLKFLLPWGKPAVLPRYLGVLLLLISTFLEAASEGIGRMVKPIADAGLPGAHLSCNAWPVRPVCLYLFLFYDECNPCCPQGSLWSDLASSLLVFVCCLA